MNADGQLIAAFRGFVLFLLMLDGSQDPREQREKECAESDTNIPLLVDPEESVPDNLLSNYNNNNNNNNNKMMRSFILLGLYFLPSTLAWTTGSAVSSFGGSVLITGREATPLTSGSSSLVMKKGKSNVPPNMRGQYARQKEMAAMRDQMIAASKPGDDGLPVFNLFVRTKRANVWYPCGSFKGDERSAALAKSYSEGGLLSGISKKQLDGGIAGSLWQDQAKLKESIIRAFPQLKKSKDEFEFGYKLGYEGLAQEKADEMVIVVPKENKGVFDGLRNVFS